jgi:hypothetical protein
MIITVVADESLTPPRTGNNQPQHHPGPFLQVRSSPPLAASKFLVSKSVVAGGAG